MPSDLDSPLSLRPRLDPKPWGDRRLGEFGLILPPDVAIGEAVVTAPEAIVSDSSRNGSLGDLVAADPAGMLGQRGMNATGGRPRFPVLVKLIDAARNLSIQLHPDDEGAPAGHLGKTEVYHVLASDPGAAIALGLLPGVTPDSFAAACRSGGGTAADLLRWLPAIPGTTILIPAGTVHALGAGSVVFEAQQPSDVTYRLDDWGRLDAAGRPRELHLDAGLAVLDPASRPEPIAPLRIPSGSGRRQLLAACRYFALERIALAAGEAANLRAPDGPQAVTCLRGAALVTTVAGAAVLNHGGTVVLPAAAGEGDLVATRPCVVLRTWVPDLTADVVDPARRGGYDDRSIAALAGPLPDVREALDHRSAVSAPRISPGVGGANRSAPGTLSPPQ